MKRALVTGASGFLGRHLQAALQAKGMTVMPAGRSDIGDIAAWESWEEFLREKKPEVIFHLMGSTNEPDEAGFDSAHVEPTRALLLAASEMELKAVPIFVLGSAAEYGNVPAARQPISERENARPVSAYGRSKLRATEAALDFAASGLHVVVVRLFNTFGHGMSCNLMPGPVLGQLRAGSDIIRTGPLDRVRDFLSVDVAMNAFAELASNVPVGGTILNLCSGEGMHLREVVGALIRASGLGKEILETGADSPFSEGVQSCVGDPGELAKLIGFRPQPPSLEDFARLVTARNTPGI